MSEDKFKFQIDRSTLFLNIRIIVTIVVFTAVSSTLLFNTTYLRQFITQRTTQFAHDLTFQHTSNINKEFNTRILNMNMIADSLIQTNSTATSKLLEDFLKRKAELSIFSELYFIGIDDMDKEIKDSYFHVPYHEVYLPHLHLLHDLENPEHACITHDEDGNLYYTQQIFDGKQILGLLIGTRRKNTFQDLMQLQSLNKNSISCIIDKNTKVVAAPTGDHLSDNARLDEFILFENTEETKIILEKLRHDIANLESAVYTAKNEVNHENIIISYNPLGINDWGVITFIPENQIAVDSYKYVIITFIVSVLAISLFALITCFIGSFYPVDRSKLYCIGTCGSICF